ncbi:MAG TPA: pitrilysin family protein [Patescibacteria group bacterium]|nr:pitrilysin family protein [Patescibacteria group bacterium]
MSTLDPLEAALGTRPVPGTPRPFTFPHVEHGRLSGGLPLRLVHLPGRPLVTASLTLPMGAVDEPAVIGGATILAARSLTEGTRRRDALALVEAAERLGASLRAEAGWDATVVSVDVPAERLAPALELLAEVVREPAFPAHEVERLRDQRLNDLLQARADPARRADEAYLATIYDPASPYARPAGGLRETVAGIDSAVVSTAWGSWAGFGRTALVIGGDLAGLDLPAILEPLLGDLAPASGVAAPSSPSDAGRLDHPVVRVVHREGSVQSELRVGHRGLPRRTPDFHAIAVMSAILGGLFNSRLNMKLREEKGYTYGAGAGFDLRRRAGPFTARAAVNTDATAPALADLVAELRRMRDAAPSDAELRAARDYLVGVFPLRFETPGPVVGAVAGIVTHELPDDELERYRPAIESVTAADVLAAARAHLDLDRLGIVLVGDADAVAAEVEALGLGELEVVRDEGPVPGD